MSTVNLDTSVSKQFIITKHARVRLAERLNINEKKKPKLLHKAWKSTEFIPKQHLLAYYSQYKGDEPRIFRSVMGHMFVFVEKKGHLILVTFI